MLGNIEVEDAPAIVSEYDEDEQDSQARGSFMYAVVIIKLTQ